MQPSWPSLNFSVVAIQQESQQLLVTYFEYVIASLSWT